MKKLLILVLGAALIVGLYISKPADAQRSFAHFLENHEGWPKDEAVKGSASLTYQDRYLWIDAQQDGKTVYTNLFHRWFNRAEIRRTFKADINAIEHKAEEVKDNLTK